MTKEIKRNTPRDLFLHLLAVVTLYWSAVTFVALLWRYIDKFFPDVLNYNYGLTEATRFFISSLMIVFPVFLLASWGLNKIYAKEAVVRESKIRKWLIYLTLFIAALVIIVDLVTTVNKFLGGEITTRFILKALSVLVVAGVIFGYYLDDVRRNTPTKLAKYFAGITGIAVLVAVVGAFFIVGSPAAARLQQFDMKKVSDLQMIESQVNNYFNVHGKLPDSLANMNNIPTDPQTGFQYEYSVKGERSFELCATFNFSNQQEIRNMPFSAYIHSQGRNCFERAINPLPKAIY